MLKKYSVRVRHVGKNWFNIELSESAIQVKDAGFNADLLIQDTSDAERVPFQRWSCIKEGIPGELHPRTMPMIMKDMDAETAAPIYHKKH